jgi:hypothetical protein
MSHRLCAKDSVSETAGLQNDLPCSRDAWGPGALEQRRERTRSHLAQIASHRESWTRRNKYYYELLSRLLRFLVEPGRKILSVRCGTGNLLAAVRPAEAKGIDIYAEIIDMAKQGNPEFDFPTRGPDQNGYSRI